MFGSTLFAPVCCSKWSLNVQLVGMIRLEVELHLDVEKVRKVLIGGKGLIGGGAGKVLAGGQQTLGSGSRSIGRGQGIQQEAQQTLGSRS